MHHLRDNMESSRIRTEMTEEDKDRINAFARLLTEKTELTEKFEKRKKLLQLHEDAADELLLADDDNLVQYNVGDAFFFEPKDFVENQVEETKRNLEKEVIDLKSSLESVLSEIASLKTLLYSKFGNSINLEE